MPTRFALMILKATSACVFAVLSSLPIAAQQQFALKGEKLGETKPEFLKAHPSARCYADDGVGSTGELCVTRSGIEFAGYSAVFDSGCDIEPSQVPKGKNCFCGIFATFRNQKLSLLLYTVDPRGDADTAAQTIANVLSAQYGKPGASLHWTNDSESLTVFVSDLRVGTRRSHTVTIRLTPK
jgi:hypothetical protein